MYKRRVKTISVFLLLLVNLLSILFVLQPAASIIVIEPPEVKDTAPGSWVLTEDFPVIHIDLYVFFENSTDPISFTLWTGTGWGTTFTGDLFTASIKANDTIGLKAVPNMNGVEALVISASNTAGEAIHTVNFTVKAVNDAPVIEQVGDIKVYDSKYISLVIMEDEKFSATVKASDVDGDKLTYTDDSYLFDIDKATGEISFVPGNDDVGIWKINITVTDRSNIDYLDWVIIELKVLNVNDAPNAEIINPKDGTVFYGRDIYYFEANVWDDDIMHGDYIETSWLSSIDGHLGSEQYIKLSYLSEGKHKITLVVQDSHGAITEVSIVIMVEPAEPDYFALEMNLLDDMLIIKQNDQATCSAYIHNYGSWDDNATLKFTKYLGFDGEVTSEYDTINLAPYHDVTVNITVNTQSDSKIGLYFIGVQLEPLNDYDYDRYKRYEEGIRVIVVENTTGSVAKSAVKPTWFKGNYWKYSLSSSSYSYPLMFMNGTIDMEIANETSIKSENETYDVFAMTMDSDLEYNDAASDFPGTNIDIKMSGECNYRKSDLATVSNEMIAEISARMYGEEFTSRTKTTTTYSPPLDDFDFPIRSGETWTTESDVIVRTKSTSGYDGNTETYVDSERTKETVSYICLGTELVKTVSGTFEAFLIMEYARETEYYYDYKDNMVYDEGIKSDSDTRAGIIDTDNGNGFSIIYFASDVGYILKQVTYEQTYDYDYTDYSEVYDWKESVTMELLDFSFQKTGTDPDPDMDDDGMADDWEDKHDVDDPNADNDGDGYTNLEEYNEGTDPMDYKDTPAQPIDADDDGLPDTWELDNGLDPTNPEDAKEDPDGDGFDNSEEFDSGTSPFDPDDYPVLLNNDDEMNDSLLGFGRVGNIDLAYIYIIIILIVIVFLTVFAVMMRRNKQSKKPEVAEPGSDQRIPEKSGATITTPPQDAQQQSQQDQYQPGPQTQMQQQQHPPHMQPQMQPRPQRPAAQRMPEPQQQYSRYDQYQRPQTQPEYPQQYSRYPQSQQYYEPYNPTPYRGPDPYVQQAQWNARNNSNNDGYDPYYPSGDRERYRKYRY